MKNLFPEKMLSDKRGRNPLLSSECETVLQYRVQQEEQSSRIYHSMSMWLNNEGYSGAAALWLKYSKEEMAHADWSREYLLAMGITPNTPTLTAEPSVYIGLPQIIEASYDHEIAITVQITELANKALKAGDHMLYTLSSHYLKEQVEEHGKMQDWIDKLKSFGTDKIAMRWLDEEMGK
jgi:ferritin